MRIIAPSGESASPAPACRGDPRRRRSGASQANLELPRELEQAIAAGAGGIGLLRTEFLYMNREDLPDEDEQYEAYASLVRGMEGKPVTIRTLDIGGDKMAAPLAKMVPPSRQPGDRAARDPLVAEGAQAARHPARGDVARLGARAAAHPAADDHHGQRADEVARCAGPGRAALEAPRRARCRSSSRRSA